MVLSKTKKLLLNQKMTIQRLGKQLLIPLLAVEIAVMGMGLSSQAQAEKAKVKPPPPCAAGQEPPDCRPKPPKPPYFKPGKKPPPPCAAGQEPPDCRPRPPKPPFER